MLNDLIKHTRARANSSSRKFIWNNYKRPKQKLPKRARILRAPGQLNDRPGAVVRFWDIRDIFQKWGVSGFRAAAGRRRSSSAPDCRRPTRDLGPAEQTFTTSPVKGFTTYAKQTFTTFTGEPTGSRPSLLIGAVKEVNPVVK